MRVWSVFAILAIASIMCTQTHGAGIATASIDFGSEWFKVGLVKAGVPMEIVLNTESKRKTNAVVSLRNGEWSFSDPAMTNAVKYPATSFQFLLPLLGQTVDSPIVKDFQSVYPYHSIKTHPERGTVVFTVGDKEYAVEELVAMILKHAVSLAERDAGQAISGVVVTVPAYFNQAERKAMMLAASIADINIMQLINSNTAVAVNYGVFRRSEFNDTEQNIMFYDMGASSTVASIVSYQTVAEKETSRSKHPQLLVKAVGYDRFLGGQQWDLRVREHLRKAFVEKHGKKTKKDIGSNPRAMAKLMKEANRVKYILSANTDTVAQIESLFEEIDFRLPVTRAELEEMSEDLFARVTGPIQQALDNADMTLDDIDHFIIVGGGPRIPRIQAILTEFLKGRELGKGINADEAAALGGSYQAAVLSKAFQVKKFIVKDANLFPVQVVFDRQGLAEGEEPRKVARTIFGRFNSIPQKKVLSFNKAESDFKFDINYGDLDFLSEGSLSVFGSRNISEIDLSGVAQAFETNSEHVFKAVKVHFRMDGSGLLHVEGADAVFETVPVVEEEPAAEAKEDEAAKEGLLDKLGNFFSGSDSGATEGENSNTKAGEGEAENDTESENEKDNENENENENNNENEKESEDSTNSKNSKEEEEKDEEKTEAPSATEGSNSTDSSASNTTTTADSSNNSTITTEKVKSKPKPTIIKAVLSVVSKAKDLVELTVDSLAASRQKIVSLLNAEEEKRAKEQALNALESYIYMTKDKIQDAEVVAVSTEEQRNTLQTMLTEAGDWLDEDGYSADTATLVAKINALNDTAKPIFYRLSENQQRPEAVKRLRQSINMTLEFIGRARNMSANLTEDETPWIKDKEIEDLQKLVNETSEWLEDKLAKQKELALSEDPVLKVSALGSKIGKLDRELMYLVRRPRPRPKKQKKVDIERLKKTLNMTDDIDLEEMLNRAKGQDDMEAKIKEAMDKMKRDQKKKDKAKKASEDEEENTTAEPSEEEEGLEAPDSQATDGESSDSTSTESTTTTEEPETPNADL